MLLSLVYLVFGLTLTSAWDYRDLDWASGGYPICGGENQSPINIDSDQTVQEDYSGFQMSIGYKFVQEGHLENDGHTLKFNVDEMMGASISGGPLSDTYTLSQFHLHWGSENGQGSEHTLNGESFDGELHLVHYKSSFDSLSDAVASNESDALCVVGIFLQEGTSWDQHAPRRPSQTLNNLRKAAIQLSRPWRGPGAPMAEVEFILDEFISEITDMTGMYHYTGSLTTPGCAEVVQWIVIEKPMHVDSSLLAALRKNVDMAGNAIEDNYRPVQNLSSRVVYHYDPNSPAAGAAASALSLGEACDPSDDKCAATSSCQNVTWLEYDSSYDDGSEIIPGDDYYEDMVEGNICARDCIKAGKLCQNHTASDHAGLVANCECTEDSDCCSGFCGTSRGVNVCEICWRTGLTSHYNGRDCCSGREDTDGNCECSAAGEACWDTDDHCCSGLTCLGGFGDQAAKDEGHYGICG